MRQRVLRAAIDRYAQCPPEELAGRLEADLERRPGCPVLRYLLACQRLDRGQVASAVRDLMIAYHGCPQLESASLLVFAGLNWIAQRCRLLLPVLLETWHEFRRPQFDRTRLERYLLNAFAEPDPGLTNVSALARRLWRLPIKTLRAQIREAVRSPGAGLEALRIVPA